jgi:putative membrane protein
MEDIMPVARIFAALAALLLATGTASAQGAKPSDPQIAHIAYTAGVIDIKAAKLALGRSKNKEVIAFAKDMVRDHTAVNDKALALLKKLKVTPEDNDTSRSLVQKADQEHATLSKLRGAQFDKAYAENEVAYHKTVNGALETTLIPDATNPELKDLLSTGLKIFQGHEQHAEHVVETLR